MKVITWNVNGLRSILQKGFLDFWLTEDPDILCLQETKCHPDQIDLAAVMPKGWHAIWSSARRSGYSGTVTFSKMAPQSVHHGLGIPKFDSEGRVVVTRFPKFVLFNVYFPNGGSGQERHLFKQEFLKRISTHLRHLVRSGESVILVGDYNVAYMDIDVYDPKALSKESGFLPEERAWMESFLKSGFIDCYRHFHPHEKERYTWWAYYQNAKVSNRGWRIDHVCVSRDLESQLRSATIMDDQGGSDHCPVKVELDIK